MNEMNGPILVVITGPDGAGKSTLCKKIEQSVNEKYGQNTLVLASVWDSLDVGNFERESIHRYLSKLVGASRTFFIFHSILNGLTIAKTKAPKIIIVDGYFYKYAVSEEAYGVDKNLIRALAKAFPVPNLVIKLQISPDEAWQRKESISAYEKGNDFVEFQNQNRRIWNEIEKEYGPWSSLTEGASIEALFSEAIMQIEKIIP